VTTLKVGGTGPNLTVANHAVITPKFWVLNRQLLTFAQVVRLGQNRVPQVSLLNNRPNGYDTRASDLRQLSCMAQMRFPHGLTNRPNITTMMIYMILECGLDLMKWLTVNGDFVQSDDKDER
jgi:hypothetical protein